MSPNNVFAAIKTRLVDAVTSPMLVKLLAAGMLDTKALATRSFKNAEKAYAAFGNADAATSQRSFNARDSEDLIASQGQAPLK